jgi:hypothetical protein
VIDSIWESEIQRLPGKLKFMAVIKARMNLWSRKAILQFHIGCFLAVEKLRMNEGPLS